MNPLLQGQGDILSAINKLAAQKPQVPTGGTLPALDFTVPSNLPDVYRKFLEQAAKSPDIINYYNQLLHYAKGDLTLAQQQLETDYKTGVRHTSANLQGSLANLGLTFEGEQSTFADNLNKRGISLTQDGNKLTFAGGGEAQTEKQHMDESQQLRQEAEQRSAGQTIENAGLTREKGLTAVGQQARGQALDIGQKKSADIYQRAQIPYQAYQTQQQIDAQKALYAQQSGGGGSNPGGFQPTDEYAHANFGMSLANYYKSKGIG